MHIKRMVLSDSSTFSDSFHEGSTYMGQGERVGNDELVARPWQTRLIEISQLATKPRIDSLRIVNAEYRPLIALGAYMVKPLGYNPPTIVFVRTSTKRILGATLPHLKNCSKRGEKSLGGYDCGNNA